MNSLTDSCRNELIWCKRNAFKSKRSNLRQKSTQTLWYTDASLLNCEGGSASFEKSQQQKKLSLVLWKLRINMLKLITVLFKKIPFIPFYTLLKIKKYSAVKSINKMGSLISIDMGRVVYKIWY